MAKTQAKKAKKQTTRAKAKPAKKRPAARKATGNGKRTGARRTNGAAKKATGAKQPNGKTPRTKANGKSQSKVSKQELDALRKPVVTAKAALKQAEKEAQDQIQKVREWVTHAKEEYHQALTPYREACRRAGVECEFAGGRSPNVSQKVSFLVERVNGQGVRVMVKGQPKTAEVIPFAALKASINGAAYAYTDKHLGSRDQIGNKGGSLSNRLRAVMR